MLPGKKYTPEDFVRIAWRRKWLIVLPVLVTATGAAAVNAVLPDKYKSETVILVVPQRVPESYVRSTVTMRIEDRLQSISQQILSRTRLERIIYDFNLYAKERQQGVMEDIVGRMRRDIGVAVVKGDAFRVSYIGDEPRTVVRVTDRLASLFIEENLRDREQLAEGTNEFLESQLELARQRLVEQEQKLAAYQRQHSGELPAQAGTNLQMLQNIRMEIQTLSESLNRDRDRKLTVERSLADLNVPGAHPVALPRPPVSNDATPVATGATSAEQLAMAMEKLRALELRLRPGHPDVVFLKRLIGELEQQVAAEASSVPLSPLSTPQPEVPLSPAELARRNRQQELEAELANLDRQMVSKQAEEQKLRKLAEEYQARLEGVPMRQAEMAELTRDYGTLQTLYSNLLTKNEDSRIAANLERRQVGEQFKLLDPAGLPEQPFSPNRLQIYLFGVIAGLAAGIGLAALLEYRDSSFRTDGEVVGVLALPVLARIPIMMSSLERRRRRHVAVMVTGVLIVLLAGSGAAAWKLGVLSQVLN